MRTLVTGRRSPGCVAGGRKRLPRVLGPDEEMFFSEESAARGELETPDIAEANSFDVIGGWGPQVGVSGDVIQPIRNICC